MITETTQTKAQRTMGTLAVLCDYVGWSQYIDSSDSVKKIRGHKSLVKECNSCIEEYPRKYGQFHHDFQEMIDFLHGAENAEIQQWVLKAVRLNYAIASLKQTREEIKRLNSLLLNAEKEKDSRQKEIVVAIGQQEVPNG